MDVFDFYLETDINRIDKQSEKNILLRLIIFLGKHIFTFTLLLELKLFV